MTPSVKIRLHQFAATAWSCGFACLRICWLTILLALVPHATALAATITVDTAVDDSLFNLRDSSHPKGPGCSLREAIDNANKDTSSDNPDCDAGSGADTIEFSVSSITISDAVSAGEIFVISDVLLQGPVTLSGGNVTRLFRVASSEGALRLSDVIIEHGNGGGGSGGAIVVNGESLLECDGSTFRNNVVDEVGGAIYAGGTVDIDGCEFKNNQAGDDAGALYKSGGSNLVTTLTINGSNFEDNKAGTDPGVNENDGGRGGAISIATCIANITGTRFNNNTADGGESTGSGGGAIHIGASGVMNITASVFAGNQVNGDEWHGGAIYSQGELSLNFSHFGTTPLPLPAPFNTLTDPNSANGQLAMGGAIYNAGDAFILGTSFIGNTSGHNGGAFVNFTVSELSIISNSTFSDNTAVDKGGAIYIGRDDNLLMLNNVTIANNSAAEGGAIYNNGDGDDGSVEFDEVLLQNTIISGNNAGVGPNCAGGTVASDSINNVVFPASADCPLAITLTGSPSLGSAELTFSIPNIVTYALPLGSGSSALGTGDVSVCAAPPVLNLDQRAFPRPQGDPVCDIGSYESSSLGSTPTPTPSATPTVTSTPEPTLTPTPTATFSSPTATAEPTATSTATPTVTAEPIATSTATPTATLTITPTWTPDVTGTYTPTPTATATTDPQSTYTPTATATQTATSTATESATPTSTISPSVTATNTPEISPTSTASATPTPPQQDDDTPTATATASPSATETPQNDESATPTPTFTPIITTTPITTSTPIPNPAVDCLGVLGGSAVLDRCGVCNGDGTSCLACKSVSIKSVQFQLDGQAGRQLALVQRARRAVLRAHPSAQQRRNLNKIISQAKQTNLGIWRLIWSYQSEIFTCDNSTLCKTVDISGNTETVSADSKRLVELLNRAVSLLQNVRGNSRAGRELVRNMARLHRANLKGLSKIPATQSDCAA